MTTVFVESAFRHGYDEDDFYEVLESRPWKLRSRRGISDVYELYGRNYVGDYLHVAYRREGERYVVFHIRRMSAREKRSYAKHL
ncbi:MAG: hypothetical protein HY238_02550 [Acidobacteria bacterium]|nr:hypothetical protein [Acidobacteriota bacterium]